MQCTDTACDKNSKELSGMMTVEASMIMGMMLVLIVALIYLAFFLYDRCLASQDSYLLCFRESYVKRDVDRVQELNSLKSRQYGSKYFFIDSESSSAALDGSIITFSGNSHVRASVFSNSDLMPKGIWSYSFGSKARITDPPLVIRKYRRIRFTAGRLIKALK